MFAIEYKHKNVTREEPWKPLRTYVVTKEEACRYVQRLIKMHAEDGWEFRWKAYVRVSE